MATFNLTINGKKQTVNVAPETSLLWVLRDSLNLLGTKYGCGIAQCGACTVHVEGEKADWVQTTSNVHRGVSAYFCHNTYAAHILDMVIEEGKMVVQKVCCAIDCGIVVNPDAARNMAEGAITDGIGNALYGELTFKDGAPEKKNFHQYRMIRMSEAPKEIDVHFVQNEIKPTGMGEPPFPPIFGALANAMYKATGERNYEQPFLGEKRVLG